MQEQHTMILCIHGLHFLEFAYPRVLTEVGQGDALPSYLSSHTINKWASLLYLVTRVLHICTLCG